LGGYRPLWDKYYSYLEQLQGPFVPQI
jgi:hypothetical protein